jgi:signal transduction histidine kinase
MTDEVQQKIFEPFYSAFHSGIGVGMSVIKRIVDEYKGKIEIHSDVNIGTEIVITLPIEEQNKQFQLIISED